MPTLTIDGVEVTVEPGMTVLQACEEAGKEIPRFCYHERLSIAGNCRMCLVEMEKSPKPIASCAMPAGDGMVIHTDTESVKKAREGVMEFLLINHPLDCPICDQGGECDLQDQAMYFGRGTNRYHENKRAVDEKQMGPLIKTEMTRCIHCMRCVRFATEIAGVPEMGALYRGEDMEITTYLDGVLESELSGNVVDLCPVGALTSGPYAFKARSWELRKTETVDVMDAVGSNIRVDARGNEVMRVLPRLHEDVNEEWISDKTRHACDGLMKRRLDRPWVRHEGVLKESNWEDAFALIADQLKGVSGSQIAGLVGDLQDLESMAALRDLLGALGSTRVECRQDGAALETSSRAGYLFNSGIAGIEDADLILLVGTNPRLEAPLVNARIRKTILVNGTKVANVGPVEDLSYVTEQLGDDAAILERIADGSHEIAARLKDASNPVIVVGQAALARADGAAVLGAARRIAENCNLIRDDWNGFNILHSASSRVGALDLGLVCDGGVSGILDDAESGSLRVVFNLGADELNTDALKDCFTVYIGTHGDEGVRHADVILPGAAYTEKPGIYLNTEGRVQRGLRATFPPGDAREDWTILRALSDVLGRTLPYDSIDGLRERLIEQLPHLAHLDTAPREPWGTFGSNESVSPGVIAPLTVDFFATNPIARASATMSACAAAWGSDDEQGTGTDG